MDSGQKRILVPVDGSKGSDKAVDVATLLAKASGACLDILYVSYFDSVTDSEDGVEWLPPSVAGRTGQATDKNLAKAMSRIPEGIEVELHRRTGVPAREIVRFAAEHDGETIVIGSRGLGLVAGLFQGSVSQAVMESAPGTVILVK